MTVAEFKAWFDGFTEAFEDKVPTKVQWKRIKERMAEIDVKETPPVYIKPWIEVRPWWTRPWYETTWISSGGSTTKINITGSNPQNVHGSGYTITDLAYNVGKYDVEHLNS